MKKKIVLALMFVFGNVYGFFSFSTPQVSKPKIKAPEVPSFSLSNIMGGVTQGGVAALQGAIALNQAQHSLSMMKNDVTGGGEEGKGILERMRADMGRMSEEMKQTIENESAGIQQTVETQGAQLNTTITDESAALQQSIEQQSAQIEDKYAQLEEELAARYERLEQSGEGESDGFWERYEKEMARLEEQKEAELARVRQTLDHADNAIDETRVQMSTAVDDSQRMLEERLAAQEEENARLRAMIEQQAQETQRQTQATLDSAQVAVDDTRTQASTAITDATAENQRLIEEELAAQRAANEQLRRQLELQATATTNSAQQAIADTRTQAQVAITDADTSAQAAIADTRVQTQATLDSAQTAVDDTRAQADSTITDIGVHGRTAIDNTEADAQAAIADTRVQAQGAIDGVEQEALSSLEKAQQQWLSQTVMVGASADQLGYHLQYFEPGRELEEHLNEQEQRILDQSRHQFADALTDIEMQRDEEIALVLTGFEYDDYVTQRDKVVEDMIAKDITGDARDIALQVASFEYQYDGDELTKEQQEKIAEINARYQKEAQVHQRVFAGQVENAVQTAAARLGEGFMAFQSGYTAIVRDVENQIALAQKQAVDAAAQARATQAALEEENRRLIAHTELLRKQGDARLAVADFGVQVQLMVGRINSMTSEQLDDVDFKLDHNEEIAEKQKEFQRLYRLLLDVQLDYERDADGTIVRDADGAEKETTALRDLRAAQKQMVSAVTDRKTFLLRQKQTAPQVTISLGKKKG